MSVIAKPSPTVQQPGGIVLPGYGRSTLADLLPSIAAHLLPDAGTTDVLGLPRAERYVLVMVDGLGRELLERNRQRAPFLAQLLHGSPELTSAVPSTTATSLTTLGTGLPPGEHGIVGYSFRALGEVINALLWDDRLDPVAFQPHPTWFEIFAAAGIASTTVSLATFANSGLTLAGLRGGHFVGLDDETDADTRISRVVEASRRADRSFVYAYERRLDHVGHGSGCESSLWRDTLDTIDAWIEQLRASLDPGTRLLVTGDHGMLDVPSHHHIMLEDTPGLSSGVDLVGGEGRFRQLYTDRPADVAAQWAKRLGERAIVRRREEAVEQGWFGPLDEPVVNRIGDVLVAMRGDWSVMTWQRPGELSLVGQHASLSAVEMRVPLLIA
ncbi:alkaline phosphatase family protein [Brooklawnia cerclae]|uniref:Alkaline phosphatase family protein n=1 Tax=Brooklawnia cerclae TaxID=349934 RepID=A0ABX0SHZ5_9ACTN|nr:nucleotide pyrophosphatase/phosphodiesterase family protein [Brooklawnia cerclae]NIH56948.1 hypothetical protein [Brooklawnia cerclae]